MELQNTKNINMSSAIENLSSTIKMDTLEIKYWSDEECREAGISEMYSHKSTNLKELISEARKLVDYHCMASVEVIMIEDEEDTLYFYDGETEELLSN